MNSTDLSRLAFAAPEPQPEWSPFFRGCAEGRLLIERCSECGHAQFYPRGRCIRCMGGVAWAETTGRGRIFSFTIVRVTRDPRFKPLLPYTVALIDLPEGVRMTGLVLPDDLSVTIGTEVTAGFVSFIDDAQSAFPIWRVSGFR